MTTKTVSVSDKSDKFFFSIFSDIEEEEETVEEQENEEEATESKGIEDVPFHVLIMYEKPVLLNEKFPLALVSNNTLLANKGAFAFVSNHNLNIVDIKNSGYPFCYILKNEPRAGNLLLREEPLKVNDSFSQDDINNGFLTYQQDAKVDAELDFFIFAIVGKEEGLISSDAFPIKIVTDNTPPTLVNKNTLPVHNSSTAEVTKAYLYATDNEQGPEGIFFELVTPPKLGSLTSKRAGLLAQGALFTQEDIDKGDIFYKHFGQEKENDSFHFIISDGAGGVATRATMRVRVYKEGTELPQRTFDEGAKVEGEAKKKEEVEESSKEGEKEEGKEEDPPFPVNISSRSIISAHDVEQYIHSDKKIIFEKIKIISLPKYGKLFLGRKLKRQYNAISRGIPVEQGEEISREKFAEGLISYQHHASHTEDDSFQFEVYYAGRPVFTRPLPALFPISIDEENTAPVVIENKKLFIKKGWHRTISKDFLQVIDNEQGPKDLRFTIISAAENGFLKLGSHRIQKGNHFTQEDINNGRVSYHHNDTEDYEDHMVFAVDDGTGGLLDKLFFHVEITTRSFALLNNNPISVLANESTTFSANNLCTISTDEKPHDIVFILKQLPKKGALLLNKEELKEGMSFTQKQINNGELSFQHKLT